MIRPTQPADTQELLAIAQGTGVFKPLEIQALEEVLEDYHAHNSEQGHRAATYEEHDQILGFVYFAPAAMTDRTWYLYWIAVTRHTQARGIGGKLLKYAEQEIEQAGGRILLIETSSLGHYEPTRRFYVKHHYDQATIIPDYYADGDSMVIFSKRFGAKASGTG